ncbi:MAG: AraC family transcriptional regulator [Eubacteriales bacterium]
MYWNLNKGVRAVIINDTNVDVHIVGFAVENNHKDAPEVDNNKVNHFTIHYILEGRGYLILRGVKHELKKDTMFVTFPNQDVKLRQNHNESWKIGWFVCDGLKVPEYLERIGITPDKPYIKLQENKNIRSLFSLTPYQCSKNYNISDAIALSAFYKILIEVYKQNPSDSVSVSKRSDEQYVANAIEYINQNYSDPSLRLETVSEFIGISPKYLSSIFKKVSKVSFTKFLLNKRLSAANALMEEGCRVVSEVAYKVGFSSPYYFSNVYKKYNKDSPSEHIKHIERKSDQDN